MRILLDEDTPRGVRRMLPGHDVRTAREMGWAGYANGRLLNAAESAGFEVLVTADQNFVFQQNLTGRKIAVVVLSTNIWPIIRTQRQAVQSAVASASPGTFSFANFDHPRPTRPPSDLTP
jgi:predicted nuclease of predicted toxin-antitoxin system